MATVRIGDFSGGTSEVLDPSLIAPNAAVSSYNLDPRTGVFSPIKGLSEGTASPYGFLDFIEHDGGHTAINTAVPTNYVRWGDYLLWNELRSYQQNYPAQAAKFDATSGARTEERDLGMAWTTETENAAVALRPIRAAVMAFETGSHQITGDILLNIQQGEADPAHRLQRVAVYRQTLVLRGDDNGGGINVAPGDYVIQFPPYDHTGAMVQLCGVVGVVTEVLASGSIDPPGGTAVTPFATVVVSRYGAWPKMVAPSESFGIVGFREAYGSAVPEYEPTEPSAILIKRHTTTMTAVIALARGIRSRDGDGAELVPGNAAARRSMAEQAGGMYLDLQGAGISAPPAAYIESYLYDYTVRTVGTADVLLVSENTFAAGNGSPQADAPMPSKFDLVHYWDESPGATEQGGKAILGELVSTTPPGLSGGIYKYAFTRVDDWGRESAPWPYLLDDKKRPRIDATTEAAATSTLGALFVGVSGMPVVPANWKLNVYRTRADGAQYFFHSKLDTAVDFVDTVSDFDLSVVPMLAEQNYPPLVVPVDEEAKVFTQYPPRYLCEYRGTLFGAYKNRLMFGAPGRFFAWPPGNYVMLPSTITGILPAGDVLLVFTLTSTYRLTGNTFSTMDFRKVSDEYGCVANRTACLVDRRPMWCALNGVATFDGVRVSIVTDGILLDNSEQFRGATAACSYRGEYYLLLTPTRIEPTRTRKGEPIPTEIEPRQRYWLRIKPGAWVTHGVFTGNVTDLRPNPSDGKLYAVGGGQVRVMFEGPLLAGYWKSGRLHGGYKTLRKNAATWFVTVTSGTVRVQIEADGEREVLDRFVTAGDPQFITFPAGVWFNDLAFAFSGSGTVTEFGFDFEPRKAQ